MGIRVFWLEPSGNERVSLRRSSAKGRGPCTAHPSSDPTYSYHSASVVIGDEPDVGKPGGEGLHPHDDPRWPAHCACSYAFATDDSFFLDRNNLYRRVDTGDLCTLRDAPVGAMWDCSWFRSHGDGERWTGPDGISLAVRTPGGSWNVDSQASNCTRDQYGPGEIDGRRVERMWLGRTHYCWVRHGDPRTGNIHVDKNGETCSAGAGSIQCGSYHGFLHNGELTAC